MNEQQVKFCEERFATHERRLNNHGDRIDTLERTSGQFEVRLENLIKQLESLTTTMRWFTGVLVGALVSFFFYAVQQMVF